MTWNVFMVPPVIFKSCQTERAVQIADYIKQVNPDIIVLDETFMESTSAILKRKLDSVFHYQSDITESGILKMNSGVWIFSKYPISKQDFILYKDRKGSDMFARKGARYVEISVNGKPIQLIGTHMQSLPKFRSTRIKQYHQLKENMLDVYYRDSIPQFIVGDINCNYYDTAEYAILQKTLDVLPVSYQGEQYSWNGLENDLVYKFSEHTLETLDYILLRKHHKNKASIKSTEILKPMCDCKYCSQDFHYFSDHHPVISTIELK